MVSACLVFVRLWFICLGVFFSRSMVIIGSLAKEHQTLSPSRNIEIDVGGVQEELLYKLYKFFSIGFTQENWMGGGRKLDEKSYKFKRFKGRINK